LIGEDSATGDVIGMFEQLKYATPIYSIFGGGRGPMKDKTLVHEIYVRPNDEFPNGRLLIVAGCQLVYAYDSPYFFGAEPIQWHPYKFYSYEPYIGRFWGKSLVEQLVPIQVRINEINTAIIHNANTLAKPNICAAEKQLKRGILNGEGANVYTYNMVPNAPPPLRIPRLSCFSAAQMFGLASVLALWIMAVLISLILTWIGTNCSTKLLPQNRPIYGS
jgi:hypothetical protein